MLFLIINTNKIRQKILCRNFFEVKPYIYLTIIYRCDFKRAEDKNFTAHGKIFQNWQHYNSNDSNNSKIFDHFEQTDHSIKVEDFKIITSCPNEDLYILESIYIHELNPNLNERNSSFDLSILK